MYFLKAFDSYCDWAASVYQGVIEALADILILRRP